MGAITRTPVRVTEAYMGYAEDSGHGTPVFGFVLEVERGQHQQFSSAFPSDRAITGFMRVCGVHRLHLCAGRILLLERREGDDVWTLRQMPFDGDLSYAFPSSGAGEPRRAEECCDPLPPLPPLEQVQILRVICQGESTGYDVLLRSCRTGSGNLNAVLNALYVEKLIEPAEKPGSWRATTKGRGLIGEAL